VGKTVSGDVTISNVTAVRNGATLEVRGTVKNNDPDTLNEPNACAVVYTSAGDVVLVFKDETFADLKQDDTNTLDITAAVPDSSSVVDHVDVYVDGLKNGVPTSPESQTGIGVTGCPATATSTNTATPVTSTPTATTTPPATNTATVTNTPTSIC